MSVDPLLLTAEQILAATTPDRVYSREGYENEWKKLRSKWHTDKGESNRTIFQHLKELYERIPDYLKLGVWDHEATFKSIDGKTYSFKFLVNRSFELGEMYIGNHHVVYALTNENEDLYKRGVSAIKGLKYPDDKIKKEVSRYVPEIVSSFRTAERHVLVVKKDADLICLRDVMNHLGGTLDSKHVAWIMSRCYNLSCYLKMVANLMHGDISPDTYFISPEDHRGALLGGWWYAQELGRPITALPSRTLDLDVIRDAKPVAESRLTGELIRSLGRELSGDVNGSKLLMSDLKQPMLMWLLSASSGDALKEYKSWMEDVLKSSFGPRKFVEFKLTHDEVYK